MATDALVERFARAHADGAWLACCLDFDGTLAPIVARPDAARPSASMRMVLATLRDRPRVRVAIISGRPLDDLRQRVGVADLDYAGSGGMQLHLDGLRHDHPDLARHDATAAACGVALAPLVARWPGAWLQQKPGQVTLHYRDVAEPEHADLEAAARDAIRKAGLPVRLLAGPQAIECAPRAGWDKGDAVDRICDRLPGGTVLPLYAGDHGNDADGFRAARRRGGAAIGIGPDAPAGAELRLADPDALGAWLAGLAHALGADPARHASGSRAD